MKILQSAVFWLFVGFGVGLFWLWHAFATFTARDTNKVLDVIAVLTCPPLYFDIFMAPLINAGIYGSIAYLWLEWRKGRSRSKAAPRPLG